MKNHPPVLVSLLCALSLAVACSGGDDPSVDPLPDGGSSVDGAPPSDTPCGPDTCTGCCDGDTCLPGSSADACGAGGDDCQACSGESSCTDGTCQALSCAETCDGCCDGEVCLSGAAPDACGAGGADCTVCGTDFVCEEAQCVVDAASRWDVFAIRAELFEDTPGGGSWDPAGGLPDAFIDMLTLDGPDSFSGSSGSPDDTLEPVWNEVVLEDIPARALIDHGLEMEIKDDDLIGGSDSMGRCILAFDGTDFTENERTITCPTDLDADPPRRGWTLVMRLRRQ